MGPPRLEPRTNEPPNVTTAAKLAVARLDDGFFKVRMDRLTGAEVLKKGPSALGPRRANIINKGMIYSSNYGKIDFTVPLFDDFLQRDLDH
jgi:hypothetical protein